MPEWDSGRLHRIRNAVRKTRRFESDLRLFNSKIYLYMKIAKIQHFGMQNAPVAEEGTNDKGAALDFSWEFNFTPDPAKEGHPRLLPHMREISKIYDDFLSMHDYGYIPMIMHVELFYRFFGVQPVRPHYFFYFVDGKPVIKACQNEEKYSQKIDKEIFQTLYDRCSACISLGSSSWLMLLEGGTMISINNPSKFLAVEFIMSVKEPSEIEWFFEGAKPYVEVINKEKFCIATYDPQNGINTIEQTSKKMDIDVKKNYNDDIPYDRMVDVLSEDGKSLILFYGEPGTGKSTIIRKLISEVDRKFILMDPSIITTISDTVFVSFLSENKGSVIVLEDCEKLLRSREVSTNHAIGTVLNLTDGIIGDSFGIKFICTFNSDIKDVDEAILRKGRLSLKYEFGKLALEKAKAIYPDAKEDMTIADAYFAINENDFSKDEKGKLGF